MSDDIEAFLRRAAQKRQAKSAAAPGGNKSSQPNRPAAGSEGPKKRPEYTSTQAERRPAAAASKKPEVSTLAVDQADERMAAHVKQVFDHPVSTLAPAAMVTIDSEAPPIAVAELVRMLSVPGGIQSAILLREILDRPTHRW